MSILLFRKNKSTKKEQ